MSKRVLIAPLHWGLGHATRCIPLIREQLEAGNEVIIAAHGGPKALLTEYFPQAEFVDIPFMTITYPADGNMARHFFWQGPKLLGSIWREHRMLQRIVGKRTIDLVISDSRFGLWTRKCRCVFVSHQLEIRSPKLQGMINRLNRWIMNRYDEVWVPDYQEFPGLAGELSHPKNPPKNLKYIGPQSRFSIQDQTPERKTQNPKWQTVALISGPEPQRSRFEADLVRQFIEEDQKALVLRGKPEDQEVKEIGNLKMVGHLPDDELVKALKSAEKVIARSGYSTIMDFHVLNVKAEFVPTPGQTEQEYLASLDERG